MREVDLQAHGMALETAICALECASRPVREDGVEWMDVDPAQPLPSETRYLELRGALVRHPSRKNWLRLVQPGALE